MQLRSTEKGTLLTQRQTDASHQKVIEMNSRIVLGLGTGQCGLLGLADVLNRQPGCAVTYQDGALLPWLKPNRPVIPQRFQRMRGGSETPIVGDSASFYLPYVDEILATESNVRLVCLKRPCDEVIGSFNRFLDRNHSLAINHWTREPGTRWHHDPLWTRIYPQYPTTDRDEGIRRYWEDYYDTAERLAHRHPDRVRVFDPELAFDTEQGLRELLSFVGVPEEHQVMCPGRWKAIAEPDPDLKRDRPLAPRASANPMDPRKCVVLVPFHTQIVPSCDDSLKELERRGYPVRRVGGYAAIDQGRNQMATDSLLDGFEETFWIDADVGFHPDAIDRIRAHNLPMVTGMCAQKGRRAMATHVMPGTTSMTFGQGGGLYEVMYAGAGFLHVRREVYLTVMRHHQLPVCNERFGTPMIPFFHPMLNPIDEGTWYLAEDYSFAQRARDCGFKIHADTTHRLWHFGNYPYGWEEAGRDVERFDTFTLYFGKERRLGHPGPAQ